METLVTTERRHEQILTDRGFMPVNDEYRPFDLVDRRDFIQERYAVPLMVKCMKLPRFRRILEIGCGAGVELTPLFEHCEPTRLVGIDIEIALLKLAEQRLKERGVRAELYQEDVRRMPFADGSFDIVVDFGTCYHINRRVMAIKEISRVLSKGGIFVFETPLSQFFSHPGRSFSKRIPFHKAPQLRHHRSALIWSSMVRQ